MFRRKKRKGDTSNGSLPQSSPLVAASPDAPSSNVSIGADHRMTVPPLLADAFKEALGRSTDRAKDELVSSGKIRPMAFFVYTGSTMKVVFLSFKDEFHKESLIQRIKEKALAENAFAVIMLTEMDNEGHEVVLSGVSPGMKASACVDYSFEKESKTLTSWKVSWPNRSFQNAFLDGIFDTTS
jgi:hypothetical protein